MQWDLHKQAKRSTVLEQHSHSGLPPQRAHQLPLMATNSPPPPRGPGRCRLVQQKLQGGGKGGLHRVRSASQRGTHARPLQHAHAHVCVIAALLCPKLPRYRRSPAHATAAAATAAAAIKGLLQAVHLHRVAAVLLQRQRAAGAWGV